jgi:CheY-like chemotaxis protein
MALRVLLVEDEYLIRLWLADCLREAGFDVTEAENGDRALALLDIAEGFDLLITDLHMPGRADGNAVAAGAKLRYPGLPVIYATGRCDSLRNKLAACDALVAKPYTSTTMLTTAQRLLDTGRGPGNGGGPVDGIGWPQPGLEAEAATDARTLRRGDRETARAT